MLLLFKVVSEREQVLMVPMEDLEDVKKNITESVNEEIDKNSLTMPDTQSFTQARRDFMWARNLFH